MRVCSFAELFDILSVTVGVCKPAESILIRVPKEKKGRGEMRMK